MPEELVEEAVPVLEARLPEQEVRRLIPVELSRLDPLAEAEPSLGALVRLRAGMLAVAVYGTETGTLSLRLPTASVSAEALRSLLKEIPLPEDAILWTSPETHAPTPSLAWRTSS
jgi:hypothetical protein